MKTFTKRLFIALENELSQIALNAETPVEQIRDSIKICKKAMAKLKAFVSGYTFADTAEEIEFFKVIKPKFYSKYIYFINIYNYHMKQPPGGDETLKQYINVHLSDIKTFFDHNLSFYQYYRSGSTHQDQDYFTRGGFYLQLELEDFEEDEQYSTSHDYKLSKIMANEKILDYLNMELVKASHLHSAAAIESSRIFPFDHPAWTAGMNDAVELIYALKASGTVNNGNIDISELVGIFEFVFQMELKEYYRKFIDISQRKKEVPIFLNKLKDGLLRWISDKFSVTLFFVCLLFQVK